MKEQMKKSLEHTEIALKNIYKEIEVREERKLKVREKIADANDELEELKAEGADRKEIREARKKLALVDKELVNIRKEFYWYKAQEKTALDNIAYFKKQLGID